MNSQNLKPLTYSSKTLVRAERSLICSPFNLNLLIAMQNRSVALGAIAGQNGVKQNYINQPLSELVCDNALSWLIDVGVLRREVDGQGITDGFRLTPLGHQLIDKLKSKELPQASLSDRLFDFITHWLRLPF